jgi:hypothetical protein
MEAQSRGISEDVPLAGHLKSYSIDEISKTNRFPIKVESARSIVAIGRIVHQSPGSALAASRHAEKESAISDLH